MNMEHTTTPQGEITQPSVTELTPVAQEAAPSGPTISEAKLSRYREQLVHEQNLPLGVAAGITASVVMGLLWAAITVITEFQIGYMAVAVGFGVGYAVRYAGRGLDKIFGVTGAVLALLGCLLGNFFSVVGFAAKSEDVNFLEVLAMIDYGMVPGVMVETFSPMDVLFYGIAIYEGYKFSFRQITEEELVAHAAE
jgi:hypothetical protein